MHRPARIAGAFSCAILVITAALSCDKTADQTPAPAPVKVIFESDLGNDTDDVIAMHLLHTYVETGKAELLAVNVNKKGLLPAEFADVVNTFYGRGDIPIGVIDGTSHEEDAADDYCRRTLDSVKFERSIKDYSKLPAAYKLSRKLLAAQPDTSVTFISVGFSTNLAALLDSPADEYSPLGGRDLVASKVKLLSVMACNFAQPWSEFNVAQDIASARKVFEEWPTDIVFSPWELGDQVRFKGANIDFFEWYLRYPTVEKYSNPVAIAYRKYLPMPYDRQMWDPTATIYGVEGEGELFTVSPRGTVSISESGISTFNEDPAGRHRVLSVTKEQAEATLAHLNELSSRVPDRYMRDGVNYDKDRIPAYGNVDPLTFKDGRKVRYTSEWKERREEILEIFQSEMYGRMPAPCEIYLDTLESGPTCHGYGTRTQVRMWFKEDHTGPFIDWLCVTPNKVKGKSKVALILNYGGNHTVLPDEQIIICDSSFVHDPDCKDNLKVGPEKRGYLSGSAQRKTFPVGVLLAKGYSLVTASYNDISPDPEVFEGEGKLQLEFAHSRGVFELWEPYDSLKTDGTTALTAWGWALSRGMDMIERSDNMDPARVLLTGYSRLGKAALIAGAFDERFPVTVPVQTGGGGVPLARRNYGENVMTMTYNFKHWYCPAYSKYARNEENMPFDQHMFLACIAPRALLVEGYTGKWFDPEGEFLSIQAANPVWKFLGQKGLPENAVFPELFETTAIGPSLGYVWRDNEHGLADDDWMWAVDFADKVFER